ncbi:MAG TPA: hypothetical protein VGL13_13850, partial [Polyangiaceae bacterium]
MSPQIPFTSKRPSRFSIFSVSPLAASLQPGRPKSIAARGEAAAAASEPTWGKRALRHVAPALAALGLVGGVWAATHHHEATATAKPVTRHGFASPSTKATDDGSTVRWRKDSIDVVVDQTFSDLAGDKVYGNAVDAWRATGATLPSVSTTKGQGRKVGYDPDGSNENIVVYAPYGWAKANGALAITVLTYDDMSGGIVDADVLMNGGGRYFANFDHDQSSDDDDGSTVSIEGNKDGDDSTTTATIKTGQTPRFDVQNVLTHELGHFFGLGEDYTDAHATMYASTRPGETNKRVVTPIDSGVVTALYAQTLAPAQAGAGCGGAKLAQGDTPTGAGLVGFGAAAAGLMLLAASRRNRAVRLIPVRARRGSRAGLARY